MEDEFSSIFIGDNTLAAIDIAENVEKLKKSCIVKVEDQSRKGDDTSGDSINVNCVTSNFYELEKYTFNNNHEAVETQFESNPKDILKFHSVSEKYEVNTDSHDARYQNHSSRSDSSQICKSEVQKVSSFKTSKCNLEEWKLPSEILKKYKKMGVENMFHWQVECLSNELVLSGKNLIYSAPTSAGKTLVAEILTIKTVLERKKKAVIILPFVSVVKEKSAYFQTLLESNGIRVEGFMGGYSPSGGIQRTDIAVCTIEKANSLINRLMEDGSLSALGIVVVDELHLLGDPNRGYLLELLLTKIRYMCARDNICIQIVGMSATLPNLELLANWLHAELYETDFRPVPLKEFIKLGKLIYDKNMKQVSKVNFHTPLKDDSDDVTFLCIETIAEGFSVLIFCPTKNWCEKLAEAIARDFYCLGTSASLTGKEKEIVQKFIDQINKSPMSEVLEKLKCSPVGLDPILAKTVSLGVAFHHAGLTMDERDILEASFRSGALRVLVATSTLSSGVNLPARRVIVRTPVFHGKLIDILTYRQMIGRAGRMGVDTAGESILVCHEKERGMVERLLLSELPPIQSCLGSGRSSKLTGSLKRAIFEVVASGVAHTPEDIESYANFTLLVASMKRETSPQIDLSDPLKSCIKYLEENEFIRLKQTGDDGVLKYMATHLGEACLAASLPPDQALALFEELQRARKCFVLEDELHIVYQVTPFSVADQWGNNLDWLQMLNVWESLPPSMQRVGELVGIEERFIVRAMRGSCNLRAPKQIEKMAIHRRFYTSLALQELSNEVPLNDVAQKYGCSRGMLQNLQQSAATFAGMVTQFCRRLRWSGLELLASQFQDRLQFGIRRELCDLMRLPMLDGQCARALFDAGIETLAVLAVDTSPEKIDEALRAYLPFQSEKGKEKEKEKWKSSWGSVKNLLGKNAAFSLIEEARKILQKDLGVSEMKWKSHLEDERSLSSENNVSIHEKPAPSQQNENESNSVLVNSPFVSFGSDKTEQRLNHYDIPIKNTNGSISTKIEDTKLNELIHDSHHEELKSAKMEKSLSSFSERTEVEKFQNEPVIHLVNLDLSSHPDISDVHKKSNSVSTSKHFLEESPATPPVSSFVLNDSGRKSDSSNKKKRNSIDIFASPVVEEFSLPNVTEQSPSLFGDSFTIDTQLGSLLDGSSGSNKVHLSSISANDDNVLTGRIPEQDFTPKSVDHGLIIAKNSPFSSQSTHSINLKPFPPLNKLNFNKTHLLHTSSPQDKNSGFIDKTENLEVCPIEDVLTPSKWDCASFVTVDICDENQCDLESDKANIEKGVAENTEEMFAADEKNLSVGANGSSFLERAFTTAISFDDNFTVRVEDDKHHVEGKEIDTINFDEKPLSPEGEGWGSHRQNCSMEAIHHSIVGILPSDEEEENDMIISSQGETFRVSGMDLGSFSSTRKSFHGKPKRDRESTCAKSEIFLKSLHGPEKSNSFDVSPVKIHDVSIQKNTLSTAAIHTNETKISYSEVKSFNIIDVCKDSNLFKVFCEEFKLQKKFSFSVSASQSEKSRDNSDGNCGLIGGKDLNNISINSAQSKLSNKRKKSDAESENELFHGVGSQFDGTTQVEGISFSWGDNNVYFMSLVPEKDAGNHRIPSYCDRVAFLKRKFESIKTQDEIFIAFDLKEHLKALIKGSGILPVGNSRFWDPKIADWLLHPTGHEKNLRTMCLTYCSELWQLLESCGGCSIARGGWTLGFDSGNSVPSRLRSAIDALVALKCMTALENLLHKEDMLSIFTEFEMPAAFCLVQMEVLGVGFSELQGNNMKALLLSKMRELEQKAYMLVGHSFKISSPAEVGKVLYRELRLPYRDSKISSNSRNKKKWSTCKQSLEKLSSIHHLPRVLLDWRKINAILTKTIHPLLRRCQKNRIFGIHIIHTATGRISMHEPNLQNIPRDFEISSLISEQENSHSSLTGKHDLNVTELSKENNTLSIRHCFIPAKGFVFLSADYSQLELRIMAHLSKDKKLCSILNKGTDVFTTIASLWKDIDSTKVTPNLRQQAKKICYGITYGIGCKSLSEQLEVEEQEASNFMETFKNSFPGLKAFLISTVEQCKADGYVRTMRGRKRELPAINSPNRTIKAQAERQAVNTVVQGSAADLVKAAMVRVEARLCTMFPPFGYRSLHHNLTSTSSNSSSKRPRVDRNECSNKSAGAILMLHLHDELLYEVAEHDLKTVAHIVKSEMEAAWKISVDLPVNLKVGESWGTLHDFGAIN